MWSALDKGKEPVRLPRRVLAVPNRPPTKSTHSSLLRRCRHIAISLLLILVHTSVSTPVILPAVCPAQILLQQRAFRRLKTRAITYQKRLNPGLLLTRGILN